MGTFEVNLNFNEKPYCAYTGKMLFYTDYKITSAP